MPIYEFECENCGEEWEEHRSMGDFDASPCTDCGSLRTRKLLSKSSFHLRGRGWEKDGYSKRKLDK